MIKIGSAYHQAKDEIVDNLVRRYAGRMRDFKEFFEDAASRFGSEDQRSRSCYSCLGPISEETPLLVRDDVGISCSFHRECLFAECVNKLCLGN